MNKAKSIHPDTITHQVYSIYDSKMAAYLPPFIAKNEGVAIRMVVQACTDPNSQFHKFAGDYSLFYLADFNEDNGRYDNQIAPENLGTLLAIASSYGMPAMEEAEQADEETQS